MRTLFTALRSIFYATCFVLLWRWVALQVRPLDARWGWQLPSWTPFLGWLIGILGAAIVVACVAAFVARGRGTPAPFDAPRNVVAAGPYKCVRNPMYIGALTLLAGFGLWLRSGAMVLFAAAMWLFAHVAVVYLEEPDLRRKFGASYEEYCRTVPRWLPRFRGARRRAAKAVQR